MMDVLIDRFDQTKFLFKHLCTYVRYTQQRVDFMCAFIIDRRGEVVLEIFKAGEVKEFFVSINSLHLFVCVHYYEGRNEN